MEKFLFARRSDSGIAILRIGLALAMLFYALTLRNDWREFFRSGGEGVVSRDLAEAILSNATAWTPRLGWLVAAGQRIGLKEDWVLDGAWWVIVMAGVGLLIGFYSRASAILLWVLHLTAAKSDIFLAYGADNFMTIGLFYLSLAPFPDRWSIDFRFRRIKTKEANLIGFFQRVLQLHLSLIYFFSGTAKLLGTGWWTGESIWRALSRPPFGVVPEKLLLFSPALLVIFGISVVVLETTYPLGIWLKRTQRFYLIGVIALHFVIGVSMRLYLFAWVMMVLNLAAFIPELAARRTLSRAAGP